MTRIRTLSFAPIQGQHDGTVGYGVDVREDNEVNEGEEGLTVTFVDD